ncbi:MAG TPA: LysR substrate-binding domain-containing protein [Tepidisphaeraceae bacterium]|nr:LysR substrate-binding domain-containing protein [Tepidisphaeraceae bacterium]
MNYNHVLLFRAVAEAGSFTKAAERVYISQPALSQQIGQLESALGVKLFDRLPRGVRLTQAGQILATHAERMEALDQQAHRQIQELRGLVRGRLTIGASQTIGVYLMPEVLGRFRRRYPQIDLDLQIGNTEVIQRRLADDLLDLALTEGFLEQTELDATVFQQDNLVAIVPKGHALAQRKTVTAKQFCAEPMIVREHGSGTRAVIERALARKSIEITPAMSLGSTEAVKRAVEAGIGVAIISRLAIRQELRAGTLIELPISDLKIVRPLHRLELHGKVRSPATQAFAAMLAR